MDENADGGVVTSVATENATSVTVSDDRFEVAGGNLKLAAGTTLDFETDTSPIEVTITASGDGASATHTVSVTINDVNEAPTISVADGTTPDGMEAVSTVAENVTGALLGEITLGDPDAGQTHTLSTGDDRFVTKQDDAGGWWLALADDASLSFEDGAEVTVTVTVTDSGDPAASASVDVTITVTDVNEAPTIEVSDGETPDGMPASSTVDEANAGAILGAIALSDPDAGQTHTLTVTGDDRVVTKQDDAGGWWLALANGESFDFESDGDSIDVTVTVTDSGDPAMSASADVTITVNDVNEAPEVADGAEVADAVFEGGEENSITVDLKALFSDPDGDVLTYRLDNAPDWLEMSVTVKGSGDDQTIMGTITGTGPDRDGTMEGVMIIASDTEHEGSVSFDVIVDAENDAPSRLELRVTEDDGFVVRTTEVSVDENDQGAVLGLLKVTDEDDPRHPHGQHEYSFMVDGKATDKFEVDMDGNLKLKDDKYLNHEDGDEITLTVTATDMHVTEPGEGEDHTTGSVSLEITINVGDVASADRPVANRDIDDWWVTVDDDLDAEDVHEGEWLSFGLDTTGDDAAFSHEDGDDLTYSVSVVDSDGNVVNWLQIDEDGKMTNKEEMLPERGVYTVTVTATDEDGDSAQTNFQLAVALSDSGDDDNDDPDIRDVEDFDYTEGSGSQMVATFSVRDDDVAIAPHPYGVLEVSIESATQDGGRNVKDLLKVMEVGRDSDSVHYAIYTKSDAELAVDADGKALPAARVPKALNFEDGDEVDITVSVKDGKGLADEDGRREDDKDISFDIVDAADEAPEFQPSAVEGGAGGLRSRKTTTIEVAQDDTDKEVIVVQLSEAWEDEDTDDDELEFDVGGTSDLPDWITVYGPDEWERIYRRRDEVDESDGGSGIRDGDEVVVIVIDRKASDTGTFSFEMEAEDEEGHTATETIVIEVDAEDVAIADADKGKVVSIKGDPSGTAPLTMSVNLGLDPNLDSADDATLVVYTWMVDSPTDSQDATMVSSTPEPLAIANRDGTAIYEVGTTFQAKVQYYELDPDTGAIIESPEYMSKATDPSKAPDARDVPTSVSFDVTGGTGGVSVIVTATGDAASASGATDNVRLQVSSNGESGWLNVGSAGDADTSGTGGVSSAVVLTVDENGDGTNGDGGGLHYRVSYSYTDDGRTHTQYSESIQLGDVADPTTGGTTNIIGGTTGTDVQVGRNLRVDTQGNDADVQWQYRDSATMPWKNIADADSLTLRVTSDYTGKDLRAKVTYTADDDPATTDVDEEGWVEWVEYTEVLDVAAVDTTNSAPGATGENNELRVNLKDMVGMNQPTTSATFQASNMFHDPDGDDLMYSITGVTPDQDLTAAAGPPAVAGREAELEGDVWRVHKTEDVAGTNTPTNDLEQSISINPGTGEITYLTDRSHTHDGTDTDGAGNTLTVALSVTDGQTGATAITDQTVTVRINVAPTAIRLDDGNGNDGTSEMSDLSDMRATATAITIADGADDDNDPDAYTIEEHVEGQAAVTLGTINVIDENFDGDGTNAADDFGDFTDRIKLSDDRFEIVAEETDDNDASTWVLRIKEDAVFDYEADGDKKGTLIVAVTATDGGGLETVGYFSIQISDEDDDPAVPVTPTPTPDPYDPEGLEDDAKDDDDDGPVIPPDDGGAFIDDLLDQFVISIDDIDIA